MTPTYRFKLRARIAEAGFIRQGDFAAKTRIDPAVLSRILQGREIPTPTVQDALVNGLNINREELADLLEA